VAYFGAHPKLTFLSDTDVAAMDCVPQVKQRISCLADIGFFSAKFETFSGHGNPYFLDRAAKLLFSLCQDDDVIAKPLIVNSRPKHCKVPIQFFEVIPTKKSRGAHTLWNSLTMPFVTATNRSRRGSLIFRQRLL